MDEREFSSQVCYMNLDAIQPEDDNARLCTRCQTVLVALESSDSEEPLHHLYTSKQPLEVTASAGCQLCLYFIRIMNPAELQFLAKVQARGIAEGLELVYTRSKLISRDWQLWIQHECIPSEDSPGSDSWRSSHLRISVVPTEAVNKNHLGTSTDSKGAIGAVCNWLKECQHHARCQREGRFLPTRLLSINPNLKTAQLVSGKNLPSGTRYLTLSHCWGGAMPFRLLKNNLESMEDSFLISHLPRTFRDAMKMTHYMGESYLWIDSLCIIQDDLNDWQIESALMDRVYSESHCNLSAAAAKTCSDGLFFRRDPLPVQYPQVSLNISGKPGFYFLLDQQYWKNSVEQTPLSSRGWALQERILSPCNVHFTSNELFWECRQSSASELFPKGLPMEYGLGGNSWSKQITCEALGLNAPRAEPPSDFSLCWAWIIIVKNYTSSKLTFEGDKLVAMAGLARYYGDHSHDEYLAGLWRKHLPEDLLWYCRTVLNEHIDREYTGPSWSWASLDGEVVFPTYGEGFGSTSLVEVVGTQIELVGQDPFGQVRHGYMTIKGSLAFGNLRKSESTGRYCLDLHGPSMIPGRASDEMSDIEVVFWDFSPDHLSTSLKNLGIHDNSSSLYLLPIHLHTDSVHGKIYDGLVLWPTGGKVGQFRRLAYFRRLSNQFMSDQRLEKAVRYFDTRAAESGLQYEELKNEEMKYTITII